MREERSSSKLDFLSIWGEEHVRNVIGNVTSDPERFRQLAQLRFEQAAKIESALARLSEPPDAEARQAYAFSLPRAIQEILILECIMELNRFLKRTVSNLN